MGGGGGGSDRRGQRPRGDLLQPRQHTHHQTSPPSPPHGGGAAGPPTGGRRTPDTRHGASQGWVRHDRGRVPAAGSARGRGPTPPSPRRRPRVPETGGGATAWTPPGCTRAGAQVRADGSGRQARGGVGAGSASPPSPEPRHAPRRPKSPRRQASDDNVSAPTWQRKAPLSGEENNGVRWRGLATGHRDLPGPGPGRGPRAPPHRRRAPEFPGAIWSTPGAWRQAGQAGETRGTWGGPRRHAVRPSAAGRLRIGT